MLCTLHLNRLKLLRSFFSLHSLQICRIVTAQVLNILTILLKEQLINVLEREPFGFGEEKVPMDTVSFILLNTSWQRGMLRTMSGSQVVFSTAKMM